MKKIYNIKNYDSENDKLTIKLKLQSYKSDDYEVGFSKLVVDDKLLMSSAINQLLEDNIIEDLMMVGGVYLEIGKSYFVRYTHCKSSWNKVKITRITDDGYPWQVGDGISGVISNDSYEVEELTEETELKDFARNYLSSVDFSEKTLPEIFADMYNSYKK